MAPRHRFQSVDEYVQSFPAATQEVLEKIRSTIKEQVPEVTEVISYNIPCFNYQGKYLIYFAGYAKHVAVYPVHPEEYPFAEQLQEYASGKATLQFPLSKPIPYDLIKKILKHKITETLPE
ncbi:MAG: DUF1801 domain-containing protein [Candidatus Doudnabacteria bacterium]|nr:DUF1801 domain-containing protein [Candidatus Doudnabacteria bacterium]